MIEHAAFQTISEVEKFSFSRKMSQISNNDRKSSPHWDPLKAGDDLEEQWYFYRSNQYFVFHPRDSCYLPSSFFYGFCFSFLFLVYVCHAIITWQIKFLEQKIMMKTHKPLSFSMNVVRLSIKAEILQTWLLNNSPFWISQVLTL